MSEDCEYCNMAPRHGVRDGKEYSQCTECGEIKVPFDEKDECYGSRITIGGEEVLVWVTCPECAYKNVFEPADDAEHEFLRKMRRIE